MFRKLFAGRAPIDAPAVPPPVPAAPAAEPTAPLRKRWTRWRILRTVIAGLLLLLILTIGWLAVTAPLSRSLQPIAPPSMTLLSADGRIVARRGAVIGRPVDAAELPAHVRNAFLAIEDRRFYSHFGIDPRGIARAAWANLRAGGVREGGSTITQQFAKLVFLKADRTFGRKAREVLIAFWLEAWLTKDQILSRYLSAVYFGDNVYGLRAAARHYFDKTPDQLDVGEAALLAGMMKAPSRLAPTTNLAGARARGQIVVAAMADAGFLSAAEAKDARPARLHVRPVPTSTDSTWFADWVLPAARAQTDADYAEQSVQTTLDAGLQRKAEAAVARARLAGAQVALITLRTDGRVVAMVGGRNYAESSFNRAVQARRQPGSTFKLFVYLAALRAGMTPDDMIDDTPLTIGDWSPENSDRRYRGRITLREAFARSSNVAAVRLAQRVGPDNVVRAARDLGIASPLNADASIALGTSSVSLIELASAYAAVAGDAWPVRPRGLPEVQSGWFGRLWNAPHAFPARQHEMLLDLLSASVNQGTGHAARLGADTFGKTGTTQDNRDAIFVGFADGLVTAVWVGHDDNSPLNNVYGGGLPARIWRSYMADALNENAVRKKPPADEDGAGFNLDLGDLGLGNVSLDVHLDKHGLRIGPEPRKTEEPPEPEPSGAEPDVNDEAQ